MGSAATKPQPSSDEPIESKSYINRESTSSGPNSARNIKLSGAKVLEKLRKHRKQIMTDPRDKMHAADFVFPFLTNQLKILVDGIKSNAPLSSRNSPIGKKKKRLLLSKFDWLEKEEIGQGSFGVIVLGISSYKNKMMAIKKVSANQEISSLPEVKKEIDLLSYLSHQNIVNFYGAKQDKEMFYIFMEYVDGGSLESQLGKFGNFNERLASFYCRQILEGLKYLHEESVIHGDLKCNPGLKRC